MEYITLLAANWDAILTVLAGLHVLAVSIVNLTPTPADDAIIGKVYKVVEIIAGIFSGVAKQLPGERRAIKHLEVDMSEVDNWLGRA